MRVIGSRLGVLALAVYVVPSLALAQQIPAAPIKPNPVPGATVSSPKLIDFFSAKTPYEFWLTCVILLAGLIFASLAISFLRQIHRQDLEHATRAMTILFLIMATMVLITAGYNNEQIAPAFGLFGTIVGYILGRGEKAPGKPGEGDSGRADSISPNVARETSGAAPANGGASPKPPAAPKSPKG